MTIIFYGAGITFAISKDVKKVILAPTIKVPLTGNKTTLLFCVKNTGSIAADIYGPFANLTRLVVITPSGKTREVFCWKSGVGLTQKLPPGKEISWKVDISQKFDFKVKGEYLVSFTVNGIKSNQLIFFK